MGFKVALPCADVAEKSKCTGKPDFLELLKPEYVAPTRAVGGPHLPVKVKRDVTDEDKKRPIYIPRIGRAYKLAPITHYDSVKRFGNGLIPFPRIGRSGTGPKRNGAGGGGSLWFGPRLGKRTFDTMPNLDANLSDQGDLYYMIPNRQSVTAGGAEELPKPDWDI